MKVEVTDGRCTIAEYRSDGAVPAVDDLIRIEGQDRAYRVEARGVRIATAEATGEVPSVYVRVVPAAETRLEARPHL